MASFEKLGGQIFFENCKEVWGHASCKEVWGHASCKEVWGHASCKEVWGHASLQNLKYRHSEVQSC